MSTDVIGRPSDGFDVAKLILDKYFYFAMAVLIAIAVLSGFSFTVNDNLLHPVHPAIARPAILYVHGSLFVAWIALFLFQTSLVRSRNVQLHRRVGWWGMGLGIVMIIVGAATAIIMRKYRLTHDSTETVSFLSIPFNDLSEFAVCFALAVSWRRNREFHRRLMLLATIALTGAAFARLPLSMMQSSWYWYSFTDGLLLICVLRELWLTRRIHPVFLYGVPLFLIGEYGAVYLFMHPPALWLSICRVLVA
ncbi:MAG TPA: hypothetical protein VHT03_02290 [Rhizomicrobium sp.]|nr:hypothetical protein [Rhizomicrobium sp.]